MKMIITDQASKWFHNEMGLSDGRGVRFYGKVYGNTPVHEGFSLAMTPDDHPEKPYAPKKMVSIILFKKMTAGFSRAMI